MTMNINDMMKQVEAVQSRMTDMQAKIEQLTVTGQSGGGMVKVTLNGKGVMKSLAIEEALLKPEDREIVEDLIVTAHNDAKAKAEAMMAEEMKQVTGGLALPPGLKLPF